MLAALDLVIIAKAGFMGGFNILGWSNSCLIKFDSGGIGWITIEEVDDCLSIIPLLVWFINLASWEPWPTFA
uniref:Uncharacterized protein n=1 Tax=Physcomitrium patens TaxID=3218 RepID=A0A2K1L7X7_PHYPA|nr:hypothetical protein PHYPA_000536 [Physcomitrium patens]